MNSSTVLPVSTRPPLTGNDLYLVTRFVPLHTWKSHLKNCGGAKRKGITIQAGFHLGFPVVSFEHPEKGDRYIGLNFPAHEPVQDYWGYKRDHGWTADPHNDFEPRNTPGYFYGSNEYELVEGQAFKVNGLAPLDPGPVKTLTSLTMVNEYMQTTPANPPQDLPTREERQAMMTAEDWPTRPNH